MAIVIDTGSIAGVVGFAVGVGVSAVAAWTRMRKWLGPVRELVDWFAEFRQDWSGVVDRPGVPGRPGMMLRISNVEHELKTNGGGSLRDAVKATQSDVAEIRAQVTDATVIALRPAQQPAGVIVTKDGTAA